MTAGYASAFSDLIASSPEADQVSTEVQGQLTKSFAGAVTTAQQYPKYAPEIVQAAKQSFVDGQDWAYLAGAIAVVLGMLLVFFVFPRRAEERRLLEQYHAEDAQPEVVRG